MTKHEEGTVTRLHTEKETCALIAKVQAFINRYIAWGADDYSFPIALWVLATYCFPVFDAFPYLTITASTKRAGKSRLGIDVMNFIASNPRAVAGMTPAAMFHSIEAEHPTLLLDEAESLTSESAGRMRQVLNSGYRRGSKFEIQKGEQTMSYDTYCPKVFVLIGDVMDTLRDRCIVIRMTRGEAPSRMVYSVAQEEGQRLREEISAMVHDMLPHIGQAYLDSNGIPFLTDRDEEIWMSIFTMCEVFCPARVPELSRMATDMCMEKTVEKVRYVDTRQMEKEAEEKEYSVRLLSDLEAVMSGKHISSADAVVRLREIPTAPWRKFRGDGLTMNSMADMLARFPNVRPVPIRTTGGRKASKVYKGYRIEAVRGAIKALTTK